MTKRFLDTNVILRHLLNDDPVQSPACFALIEAIEQAKASAWTSHLVIAELVFVLSSKRTFNLSRTEVRDRLLPLIGLPNLEISQKRLFDRVFELYTSLPIDFVDCYHAALLGSRKECELYSYDTHFDRVDGLQRLEP
ncbi:MAG: type II toxin-antitoxin system VapC family toxin [Chloroflexota bacterium]|nr:MAG: type II toxin-antitoxin system VapC family toxin [Chloroflexota bacterium]